MKRRNPPFHHRARVLGAARAVAAELVEPVAQIGVVAAEPAFGEHRGYLGGRLTGAFRAGVDHHTGEPRRQWQGAQAAAFLGDATLRIDRAKLRQQRLGFA